MTIFLYRGDYEKIDSFDLCKVSKHSYVGPGIYLTNNEEVATSYRVKGSDKPSQESCLWSGSATDRPEAYKLAYIHYVGDRLGIADPYIRDGCKNKTPTEVVLSEGLKRFAKEYEYAIADGLVKAEYDGVGTSNRTNKRRMTVSYFRKPTIGHLSKFCFDSKEFNTSMFMIDGRIRDEFFWELVWDNDIEVGVRLDDDTKKVFIERNTWRMCGVQDDNVHPTIAGLASNFSGYSNKGVVVRRKKASHVTKYTSIAAMLKPYGYKGFEYRGGVLTSSPIKHRAFCVWDAEWVNEHRVY